MKCADCPLVKASYYANGDDYDCVCMITHDYVDLDEGACHRTNKWIRSQDVGERLERYNAEIMAGVQEVIKFFEEEMDTF